MTENISRRRWIQGSAALAGAAAIGLWDQCLPALAQDEQIIPWTDIPANFNPNPQRGGRSLDTRALQKSTFITPTEEFYLVQHYGQPQVDPATYKIAHYRTRE